MAPKPKAGGLQENENVLVVEKSDRSVNTTHFCCCPNCGAAPKVLVFEPKAGGGAEVCGAPNPNEDCCCGAPNVSAEGRKGSKRQIS